MAHDAEIVGDKHVGQPHVGLDVLQQVDDLGLDRDVESRDWFVGTIKRGSTARARALALTTVRCKPQRAKILADHRAVGILEDYLQARDLLMREIWPAVGSIKRSQASEGGFTTPAFADDAFSRD